MNRRKECGKESGVAIFYILMGVILFATLTYSFVRSVNQTQSGNNKEQARVAANDVMREMKSIEQAIQKLRIVNNCSENEISFYSSEWATPADYDNTNSLNAAGDFNCFVYKSDGGGVSFSDYADSTLNGLSEGIYFSGSFAVEEVGTSAPELMIFIRVGEQACTQINLQANIDSNNDVGSVLAAYNVPFTGSYSLVDTIGDATSHADLEAESYGCLIDNNDHYVFYGVLIER